MRLEVSRFHGPKQGSSRLEYEDAISRPPAGAPPYRFAVADGASESSFARLWAHLLVEAHRAGSLAPDVSVRTAAGAAAGAGRRLREPIVPPACVAGALLPLQERWRARVTLRPLSWHAAAKVDAGAFAALVGLTVYPDGKWYALAAGDCCLFHVRADALVAAFPLEDAAQFDNRPLLIGSGPRGNLRLADALRYGAGRWRQGDTFLLMSDALAAFFLRRVAGDGCAPGEALAFTRRTFRRWLCARRAERAIRNDDVSLLRIQVI